MIYRIYCHYFVQGFWDMVNFQVEGLYKMFDKLGEMERNGWSLHYAYQSPKEVKLPVRLSTCFECFKTNISLPNFFQAWLACPHRWCTFKQ